MRKAHSYRLQVTFEDGFKWDFLILATSAEAVTMWISDDQELAKVIITLKKKNVEDVDDTFIARSLGAYHK